MNDRDELMTSSQVAERLNVTTARVRQLLLAGELSGRRIGRDWMVSARAVEEYRKRLEELPEKRPGRKHKAVQMRKPPAE